MISIFAAWLILQTGVVRDSVPASLKVYAPILEHARTAYPARPGLPVVFSETISDVECAPHCGDSTAFRQRHSAELIRQLRSRGLIQATCRTRVGRLGCPSHPKHLFVALSSIRALRNGTKIEPVMEPRAAGADAGGGSDSLAVPVDVWVEAVVYAPCPAPVGSDRCRSPDAVGYRYFLQTQPDGTYRVVARLIAWQI
jgi:hypothetical protein